MVNCKLEKLKFKQQQINNSKMKTIKLKADQVEVMTAYLPRYINRETKRTHINSLKRSIVEMGVVRDIIAVEVPHIKNDVYFIVDGQHLREAIIELKKPVTLKVIKVTNEEDLIKKISLLNSTAKNWGLMDYLKAWSTAKKESYIYLDKILVDLQQKSLSGILEAYSTSNKHLKSGDIKINKKEGDIIVDIYKSMVKAGLRDSTSSLVAVVRVYKGGLRDKQKLVKAVSKHVNIYSQVLGRDGLISFLKMHY